jgi:hypothetical protein
MKLQKRDWVMVATILLVIVTNYMWYVISDGLSKRIEAESITNYQQSIQLLKLQNCINEKTAQCGANPY